MEVVGPPKHVGRASVLYAAKSIKSDAHDEDLQRQLRNLNKPLAGREPGTEDKIDQELTPSRKDAKGRGRGSGSGVSGGSNEARSKWGPGPPIGSGLPDTGASSSNQAPPQPPPNKRSAVAPASPEGIAKIARTQWMTNRTKMEMHHVEMFPKSFRYYRGILHFCLEEVTKGLRFGPEPYAPILQYGRDGRLLYEDVTPYNSKWLRKDKYGDITPEAQRVRFEPAIV